MAKKKHPFPLDETSVLSKDIGVTIFLLVVLLLLTAAAGWAGYAAVQSFQSGGWLWGTFLSLTALVIGLPSGLLTVMALWDPFTATTRAYRAFSRGRVAEGLGILVEMNERDALFKYLDSMLPVPDESIRPLIRTAAEELFSLRELLESEAVGFSDTLHSKLKADTETAITGLWGTCERQFRVADQNIAPATIDAELTAEKEKLKQLGERIADVRTQIARLTLTSGDGAIDGETVRQFEAFADVTRQMNRFNAASQ